MSDPVTTVSLALLSHTNVGKTTLARTLLRRDIGAVMDRAHVTDVAESHVLMRSSAGDELVLWDTPGFGDSVRLQRRLAASGQPIGWFLSQVWDRYTDRAFWCSQQAMRAARESADVVLYVVNATEEPTTAGYVEPELHILDWLGKPTLVLLNQVGTRLDAAHERQLTDEWSAVLRRHDAAGTRRVMTFDAFARCWLQEHALLDAIADCLDERQRPAFERIVDAWRDRDLDVLRHSAAVIARQLHGLARDTVQLPDATLADKVSRALQGGATDALGVEESRARQVMLDRLDESVRECTAELVALHGLTGTASEDILRQVTTGFETRRASGCRQGRPVGRPRHRGARRSGGGRRCRWADVRSGRDPRWHRRCARGAQAHATLQPGTRARRRHRALVRRVPGGATRCGDHSLPRRCAFRSRSWRIRRE